MVINICYLVILFIFESPRYSSFRKHVQQNKATPKLRQETPNTPATTKTQDENGLLLDPFNGSSFSMSGCNGRLGNQLGLMAIVYPLYLKWKVKITLDDFQFSLLANTFDLSGFCSDIPGQYLCSSYKEGETFASGM